VCGISCWLGTTLHGTLLGSSSCGRRIASGRASRWDAGFRACHDRVLLHRPLIRSPIGFRQADAGVGDREMLGQLLSVGSHKATSMFALVPEFLEHGPWQCVQVSEVNQRLGKLWARLMGGKEIPPIDLAFAHVLANELLLQSPRSDELPRVVDQRDDDPLGLVVRQVTGLRQDDDAGKHPMGFVILGNLTGLVCPEDERTVVEDVSLGQGNRLPWRQLRSKGLGGHVHELTRRGSGLGTALRQPARNKRLPNPVWATSSGGEPSRPQ
jgi:hypothetical protein